MDDLPTFTTDNIVTETTRSWMDESGIAIFIAEGVQGLEQAIENMAAYRHLTNGKISPILLDFSNIKTITREAREYYTSEENSSSVLAVAIVTDSIVGRVIGNFFIGLNFNKVGAPVKMFGDLDDAKTWLQQFLKNSG